VASRIGGALAAIVLIAVGASACSGSSSVKKDSASVTIGKTRADLSITSCNHTQQGLHVVAQSGGAWTLDLRHDASTKSNILIVVRRSGGRTISYQASANVVDPNGTPPTKIAVEGQGGSLRGTATVVSSASSGNVPATARARFDLSCAKVTTLD
jgi:hypothetical protein